MLRRIAIDARSDADYRSVQAAVSSQSLASTLGLFSAQLVTLLAVGVLLLVALDTPDRIFRSPDENANYIFTKTLAETGQLAYDADYLANDPENLLHPRGAITHDGKAVPFNFFGLPVLYAPVYKLAGENLKYIAVPLALITVIALASAGALFVKDRPWIAWLAVLSAAPVLNAFSRPFLNLLPALMFGSIASYFLIRYIQAEDRGRSHLLLCSIAFALAAFVRYELAIFAALLMLIAILHKQGRPDKPALTDFSIFLGTMGLIFVLPVLALNQYTYGSPLTYGYSLFNEVYFADRADSGSSPLDLVGQARSILLPAYPFSLDTAAKSLSFHVLGVAPLFAMAAGTGLVLLVRGKNLSGTLMFSSLALAVYVYIYRGAGDSNLAGTTTPNFEASVIRYSTPLLVGFFFMAVYAISHIRKLELTLLVLGMLIFGSFSSLTYATDGNVISVRDQLRASQPLLDKTLPYIEENAVIYTDLYDKIISERRIVASWWGGANAANNGVHFHPDEIAQSVQRVSLDRPVYFLVRDTRVATELLNQPLAEQGLKLSPWKYKQLLKVEPLTTSADAATPGSRP